MAPSAAASPAASAAPFCADCNAAFQTEKGLRAHIAASHQKQLTEKEERIGSGKRPLESLLVDEEDELPGVVSPIDSKRQIEIKTGTEDSDSQNEAPKTQKSNEADRKRIKTTSTDDSGSEDEEATITETDYEGNDTVKISVNDSRSENSATDKDKNEGKGKALVPGATSWRDIWSKNEKVKFPTTNLDESDSENEIGKLDENTEGKKKGRKTRAKTASANKSDAAAAAKTRSKTKDKAASKEQKRGRPKKIVNALNNDAEPPTGNEASSKDEKEKGFRCVLCGHVALSSNPQRPKNNLQNHSSLKHRGIPLRELPLQPLPDPFDPHQASMLLTRYGKRVEASVLEEKHKEYLKRGHANTAAGKASKLGDKLVVQNSKLGEEHVMQNAILGEEHVMQNAILEDEVVPKAKLGDEHAGQNMKLGIEHAVETAKLEDEVVPKAKLGDQYAGQNIELGIKHTVETTKLEDEVGLKAKLGDEHAGQNMKFGNEHAVASAKLEDEVVQKAKLGDEYSGQNMKFGNEHAVETAILEDDVQNAKLEDKGVAQNAKLEDNGVAQNAKLEDKHVVQDMQLVDENVVQNVKLGDENVVSNGSASFMHSSPQDIPCTADSLAACSIPVEAENDDTEPFAAKSVNAENNDDTEVNYPKNIEEPVWTSGSEEPVWTCGKNGANQDETKEKYETGQLRGENSQIEKESTAGNQIKRSDEYLKYKYPCSSCESEFSLESDLKTHTDATHLSKMYGCSACQKTFSRLDVLERHNDSSFHLKMQQLVACQTCGEEIPKPSIRAHKAATHPKNLHECAECGINFSSKKLYAIHVAIDHDKMML